jgi:hypothetical protein
MYCLIVEQASSQSSLNINPSKDRRTTKQALKSCTQIADTTRHMQSISGWRPELTDRQRIGAGTSKEGCCGIKQHFRDFLSPKRFSRRFCTLQVMFCHFCFSYFHPPVPLLALILGLLYSTLVWCAEDTG